MTALHGHCDPAGTVASQPRQRSVQFSMTRVWLAVAVAGMAVWPAHGQTPTTAVSGRVISDQTGAPLPNVQVTVTSEGLGAPVVLTDADGRFSLAPVSGSFRVVASKTGYGRTEVAPPVVARPLEIRLRRGAVITGRVVDESGEPVLAARVAAEAVERAQGTPASAATTDTDDRGEYRLAGLSVGVYHVAVTTTGPTVARMLGGRVLMAPALQKTYYPGVDAQAGARRLTLQFGSEQAGVDFVIPLTQSGNQPFSVMRAVPVSPLRRTPPPDPSQATGVIRGLVTGTDGRALAYAQVLVAPETSVIEPRLVRAASGGQFEVRDLPPGRYRVAASKPGYFPLRAGDFTWAALLGSTTPIVLAAGQTYDRVEVRLWRWSTLAGHVRDEHGEPLQGASVQLLQVRYQAGRRRLVNAGAIPRLTDDQGRYRLYGLLPGQYIVSATIGDVTTANVPGYVRSYYPGTPVAAQAVFVSIGEAGDVAGIDVSLSRTRTVRVLGRMLNAAGQETTGGNVQLVPSQRSNAVTSVPVGARILPLTGAFEFSGVSPGLYLIQANRGRLNGWTEGEFGAMTISVGDTDVSNLVIRMSAGSSIAGRISFDAIDRARQPARNAIDISPVPIDLDLSPASNWASANIHEDWTFNIVGINGPRRLEALRTPPGWALKEIRVNGIDVTDRPLPFGKTEQSLTGVEVVLTDRISSLNGVARGDGSRPMPGASVLAYSTDRSRWYYASRFVRNASTGADGTFTLEGLPFGTYYVAALAHLPDDGDDAWRDPALLESLIPRASTVTVREGEKSAVTVQVAPEGQRP